MLFRRLAWVGSIAVLILAAGCASSSAAEDRRKRNEADEAKRKAEKDAEEEKSLRDMKAEREAKEAARRREVESKTDWDMETRDLVLARKIRLGMTEEQVQLSWGSPDKKNRTVLKTSVHEQWVYDRSFSTKIDCTYLYFEDGKLTSWQESD